jgi:hypothetical protein
MHTCFIDISSRTCCPFLDRVIHRARSFLDLILKVPPNFIRCSLATFISLGLDPPLCLHWHLIFYTSYFCTHENSWFHNLTSWCLCLSMLDKWVLQYLLCHCGNKSFKHWNFWQCMIFNIRGLWKIMFKKPSAKFYMDCNGLISICFPNCNERFKHVNILIWLDHIYSLNSELCKYSSFK